MFLQSPGWVCSWLSSRPLPHKPRPPQVPPAPINKDDFALVQRPGPGLSQESARRYGELTKLIRQQHEVRGLPCPGHHQSHGPAATLPSLSSAPPDVPEPL